MIKKIVAIVIMLGFIPAFMFLVASPELYGWTLVIVYFGVIPVITAWAFGVLFFGGWSV